MITMAANQSATVSVKILVDQEKSRVVCAEAGNDFVDILFSFLTLPMGTIVRLMNPSEIGCLNNLYQSVQNLSTSYLWTDACKEMLLYPRNPCEAFCRDLKVNIDDTESTKYFVCPTCFGSGSSLSLGDTIQTRNAISNLLERSLLSKCPWAVVFLPNRRFNSKNLSCEPRDDRQFLSEQVTNQSMGVKILVRKSNGKALYAEAKEDFVDLLLSFLTIPLANVVKCLAGNSSLGCIDNLYRSVQCLDDKWFVTHTEARRVRTSLSSKSLLLGPGLAQKFSCSNPPFNLCDENHEARADPSLLIKKTGDVSSPGFGFSTFGSVYSHGGIQIHDVSLIDPKSPRGESSFAEFVKRPAVFQVSDGLAVLPSSGTTSGVSLLKGLRVPIDDIEEHEIQICKQQVLNLLKASLISTSALTNALNVLVKKPKQDSLEEV